jgi:hypothetical protein
MGAKAHPRWVAIVAAASLATAVPAGAQEPASPDAAPSSSSAPRPDPAPVKTKPRIVVRAAPRPSATVTTTTVQPTAPAATATPRPAASKPARRATTRRPTSHRRKAAHRKKPAAHVALPRLPHLTLAQLSAPSTTADAGRARKLALGALSLLILALASATLLAFTARVERRRVVR